MAMIEVVSTRGAANVTVARVVARSGVSRRTFYEAFTDAEDCLLAAMEESLQCARQYALEVYDPEKPWRVRIRPALHALLRFLEDEPARGRLLVVETLGAGREVLERRSRALEQPLLAVVSAGRHEAAKNVDLTPLTAEGVVGAVMSVVHARLARGANSALVELTNPLMSIVVLPYLGPAAARRELDRPLPEHRRRQSQSTDGASYLNALPMRVTFRTVCVLSAVASQPGASNAQIGQAAGIADQGQISKLLQRLERLGLIANDGAGHARGMPNVWTLTRTGVQVERATSRSRDTVH